MYLRIPHSAKDSLVVELKDEKFSHISKEDFMKAFDPHVDVRSRTEGGQPSILESAEERKRRYEEDRKRSAKGRKRRK